MKEKNKGFTLIELIVVVSILTILLGILEPSVSSVFNFRAQRAANSIVSALEKTKTEAMNRLVGEMVLEKTADGYYISYYLHRGKESGIKQDQPEKIAPKSTLVSYTTTQNQTAVEMQVGEKLIITDEVTDALADKRDISFNDQKTKESAGNYCTSIIVKGGFRTRTVKLEEETGSCTVTAS